MADPVYTDLTQGKEAGPNQGARQVHRWLFTENSIGEFVRIAGGWISWGPVDDGVSIGSFGGGSVVLRVSPSGLLDLKKPTSGLSGVLGESSISTLGSSDGFKTARLGPCLVAPQMILSTTPDLLIELWVAPIN